MYRKLLFLSIVIVGIFFAVAVFAQTCTPDFPGCATCPPKIYEGINCGSNWYCNGCKTGTDGCFACPRGGDPTGATVLNYVSCACQCPSGQIVCAGACTTAPACSTPTREQNNSSCNGCGACKAGYSPNPDPLFSDPPNPCLKTAYIDYANIGTFFQISGDLKSASGDLYLATGKAVRIDGAGTTTLNIGNYTGTSLNTFLSGGLVVKGAMALTSQGAGTINAEKLCIAGDCRDVWPSAVSAFVDEGNVGFGPTATLGTNDNTPLAFEINNSEKMRLTAGGNLGIGTTNPNAGLEIYGRDLMFSGPFASSNVMTFVADGTSRMALVRSASSNDLKIASFNAGIGEFVTFDYEAGNVGIGTTSPAVRLEVNGGIVSNAASGNVIKTGSSVGDFSVAMYSDTAYGIIQAANYAHTGGVRPLLLNPSGGNVGVGTLAPAYKLDVAGQINADTSATPAVQGRSSAFDGYGGYFRADGANNSYGVYGIGTGGGGYFRDLNNSGYALVGFSDEGILAYGSDAGVQAYGGTYGVYGSGTSFGGYFRMDGAGGYAIFGQSFNANSWGGYFAGGKGAFAEKLAVGSPVDPGSYNFYLTGQGYITSLGTGLQVVTSTDGSVSFIGQTNGAFGGVGVKGMAINSTSGAGVYGEAQALSGTSKGVQGYSSSATGWGGYFTGGKGVFTQQLCLGTEGNCRTDWPSGGGMPGGVDKYVQFNDGGVFGGDFGFSYDKTTDTLSVNTLSASSMYVGGAANFLGYLHNGAGYLVLDDTVDARQALYNSTANNSGDFYINDNANVTGTLKIGTLSGMLKATSGTVSVGATTTDLPEGANQYFTTIRARTSVSGVSPITYDAGSGNIGLSTPLAVTYGGTGISAAPSAGAVVYGNGTNYAFTAVGSAGQFLQSNGSGAPTWTSSLNASNLTSGTVAIARGGTGLSSIPAAGQLLIGTGAAYNLANLTGTANRVIVTNGAGSVTLSAPQDIATTSSPTFAAMTLSGNLSADSNARGACTYHSASGLVASFYDLTCPDGKYLAGLSFSAASGGYVDEVFCCEL